MRINDEMKNGVAISTTFKPHNAILKRHPTTNLLETMIDEGFIAQKEEIIWQNQCTLNLRFQPSWRIKH